MNDNKPTTIKGQRTQTLYNRVTAKPLSQSAALVRRVGRTMDIARHKSIAHFAPKPVIPQNPVSPVTKPDAGPMQHPMIAKIEKNRPIIAKPIQKIETQKTLKEIKEIAIAEAIKKAPGNTDSKKGFFSRRKTQVSIVSICVVVLLAVSYFIYISMPGLSVKIASAQAGIDATFPEYKPDGYNMVGPVSYDDGEVTINFHANTGSKKFAIKQSKSDWDSSAVKEHVEKLSKGEISTTSEGGLTIYSYDNNAAWVNGGILYTIDGDAPLTGDQIRRIAVSL